MTELSPELVEHWQKECNRYTNGFCSTRRCLMRGGYSGQGPVDYAIATCEAHETVEALNASTLVDENAMLRDAAERGLEWVIEAANERKQKDAVFDNAMRDIARIESALSHKETNR